MTTQPSGRAEFFELSPDNISRPRRTLAETAASELHRMILTGVLPAGSPIRVNEIAAQLDMSAMPVRDALRQLASLGLVEIFAHRGARVRELSLADLRDTYETRIALEKLAVVAGAAVFTAEQGEQAAQSLLEHEKKLADGDLDGARRAHTDFHFTLYHASGSRWLLRAIEPAWQNSERYRFALPSGPEAIARSHQEHESLLQACIDREPDRAAEALEAHLRGAVARIERAMAALAHSI